MKLFNIGNVLLVILLLYEGVLANGTAGPAQSGNKRSAPPMPSGTFNSIGWQVMSDCGTDAGSAHFKLVGTGGQTATDRSKGDCFAAASGFWQPLDMSCCIGLRGNVDYDPGETIDISDLAMLVDFLFTTQCLAFVQCYEEADVIGDGTVDISDLSALVDYLFGLAPIVIPQCPFEG